MRGSVLQPRDYDYDKKLRFLGLALSIAIMIAWLALAGGAATGWHRVALAVLILNTSYSVILSAFSKRQIRKFGLSYSHWIHLGLYSSLIALDYPNYRLFVLGMVFAMLVAAFNCNLASALRVAASSVGVVAVITLAQKMSGASLNLTNTIFLTLYSLIFGLVVAYWGDRGKKLERRLLFLKQIPQIANPRFGVDQTVEMILQRLQAFYEAESCLLVMTDASSGKDSLHRVNQHVPLAALGKTIDKGLARVFLSLPHDSGCIWRNDEKGDGTATIYDAAGQVIASDGRCLNGELIATMEADCFISVPIVNYAKALGRLYILNPAVRVSGQEIAFLNQVLENVMRVLENIRLVDSLATEAAHQERQKIASDIHDSIVQPYIGIQIGLSALKRKIENGVDATMDIGRLIKITEAEIGDLRTYVRGLKGSRALEANFVQAVRRLALKFADASGIAVEVTTDKDLLINDRLAAEAFQIIAEGLSNIRRHTQATRASIHVKCVADEFIILINNDEDKSEAATPFLPQSISERTAALGGRILVQPGKSGMTALSITIPL
jgi:signal transduction histidine kinase